MNFYTIHYLVTKIPAMINNKFGTIILVPLLMLCFSCAYSQPKMPLTVKQLESDEDYQQFLNFRTDKTLSEKFAEINKQYVAAQDDQKREELQKAFARLRNADLSRQLNWIAHFISSKPASSTGAYMLEQYTITDPLFPVNTVDALLGKFVSTAKQSNSYKQVEKIVDERKALLPGHVAPDFSLLMPDSTKFTLSSTRGKYIMIDFWASWCTPCRKAIPHWKMIYEKYKSKGFEIVSVSNDSRWEEWTKAMEQEKMPWIQVIDDFPLKNKPARVSGMLYLTPYIPYYMLLDEKGNIILNNPSEEEMDAKLGELFKQT